MSSIERELLKKGSVKDIYGVQGLSPYIFHYSDRYSIFDWGEMPDSIPHKGEALALLANFFFNELTTLNICHHSLGLNPQEHSELFVKPVHVHFPEGPKGDDYSFYQSRPINTLVPLEIIFRFGVPLGSSLLKRVEANPRYAEELNLREPLQIGQTFTEPLIEYSTKLGDYDRYLSPKEAQMLADLNYTEMQKIQLLTKKMAFHLKDIFSSIDLTLWDGKFEFAFIEGSSIDRDFMVVDSIGPDELRLTFKEDDEIPLSKEYLRQCYHQSPWALAVFEAKKLASLRQTPYWKKIVKEEWRLTPEPLASHDLKNGSAIYTTMSNALFISRGLPVPFGGPQTIKDLHYELTHSRGRRA